MKKIIEPCGLHCIKMNHLGVTIGNQTILEDVNMHIHCGTLNAVIGRNGAGKTTLIRAILNDIPHEGSIDFRDTENGHMCNLSGGQLQRVLLSMAIMDEPNLLLLDEPVSGIDQNGMELFYRTMDYLKKNFDLAIILISHDLDYVAKYADKVLLLDKKILKQGTPKEVYASEEFGRIFGMEGRA